MSDTPHVVLKPISSVTPEQAQSARIAVLRFALDCYTEKKGGVLSTAEDGKEIENGFPPSRKISQ